MCGCVGVGVGVCVCVCVCVCNDFSVSIRKTVSNFGRSEWSRGLRCGPVAARLLGLWVRNPPLAWTSFS